MSPASRARWFPAFVLATAIVAPFALIVPWYFDWPCLLRALGLIVGGLFVGPSVFRILRTADGALATGAAAIAGFFATAIVVGLGLKRDLPDEEWLRILVAAGSAVVALFLIARDWSRRLLLFAGVLAVVGVGAIVADIGYAELQRSDAEPIADAEKELEELSKQADAASDAATTAATKAEREAAVVLTRALGSDRLPVELQPIVRRLNTVLSPIPPGDTDAARRALRAFDARYVASEYSVTAAEVRAAAVTAIESREQANRPVPATADLEAAIRTACTIAKRDGIATKCDPGADPLREDPPALDDAVEDLSLELARYRYAVTGDDEDKTRLDALVSAQDDEDKTSDVTLLDALQEAPVAIFDSVTDEPGSPLIPGELGWVLLAALGLWIWVLLLRDNARQAAGPVEVEKLGGELGEQGSVLEAEFRVAVLQNVQEPGAAPGAESVSPVTNLLDIASGGAKWFKNIADALVGLTGRRYGYKIAAEVVAPKAAKPSTDDKGSAAESSSTENATTPTRVLVRVKELRSGNTVATQLKQDADATSAVRAAGLWAAGHILSKSSRTPSWAEWEDATAHALVTRLDKSASVDDLEQAVLDAPNSGVLLVRLGHLYELQGKRRLALLAYSRAVAAHPSYRVARYRLAVGLGMYAHTTGLDRLPPGDRVELVSHVGAALGRLHLSVTDLPAGNEPLSPGRLRSVAAALLEQMEEDANWIAVAGHALRRADRHDLTPLLWPLGRRGALRRARWLARSGRLTYLAANEAAQGAAPTPDAAAAALIAAGLEMIRAAVGGTPAERSNRAETAAALSAAAATLAIVAADSQPPDGPAPDLPVPTDTELTDLTNEAALPDSWWQVSYNAACVYAASAPITSADANTALSLLEQCLVRRGVHQLKAEWVRKDPDLKLLAGDRFDRFVAQLPDKE